MILRPFSFRPIQGRPLPQCLFKQQPLRRAFHASSIRASDGMPDHYATLEMPTNASAAEIKKQFFKLSKTHHPDHNPNDPKAAERFVKVSEAYHVLGSPEKRSIYDRDFLRATQQSSSQYPQGSHTSYGPAGGRPASGLSRRRTQFKGPPPSFYRSGGWGEFGQKRADYAAQGSHQHEAAGKGSGAQDAPGTGPAGYNPGLNNDVPHFDREGHFRTHDSVQKHRSRRRVNSVNIVDQITSSTSMLFNFFLLSGVLAVIFGVSGLLFRKPDQKKRA